MTAKCTHRQAIVTKYLGPTNTRGARIKATAQAGSITLPWDYAASVEENHENAVTAFLNGQDWGDNYVGGALPDGSYAWVQA